MAAVLGRELSATGARAATRPDRHRVLRRERFRERAAPRAGGRLLVAPRAFFAVACAASILPAVASRADDLDALRDFVRETMAETGVRGAAIASLRGGRVVWLEGFGVRDERTDLPVTPRTVFQTASLGKVVAAYGALLRVEDGDWTLDMPAVSPRLRVADGCRPPALAAVLSHSAGLGNDLRASEFEPACDPPVPFSYAGQGYLVLQDLFGDAGGRDAEAFLRARVFEPLGMSSATFAEPVGDDVATGHADLLYGVLLDKALGDERAWTAALGAVALALLAWLGRRTWRRHPPLRSVLSIAGGAAALFAVALGLLAVLVVPVAPWSTGILLPSSLHASAEEMARFAAELTDPKLVRPETRDLLFAPRVAIDDRFAWAAGIGVERVPTPQGPVTTYWQWGSNPGFQGLLVLVPDRRDAIVVLTNTGGFADVLLDDRGGYVLARRIARRALDLDGRWTLRGAGSDPR